MASQRASRALRGTAPIRCGNGRRGFARAVLSNETQWHRQALTRTAEARLGWPLTREGTAGRCTAVASHHRATALQSMAKEGLCSAMAWSAGRCEARPRLRSAPSAGQGLSEDGVATARESDANKRKGDARLRSAPICLARATQGMATATHRFALAALAWLNTAMAWHANERTATARSSSVGALQRSGIELLSPAKRWRSSAKRGRDPAAI